MLSSRQITCVVICIEFLIGVAQCHVCQQNTTYITVFWCSTVVCWLRHHICKVHSLAKHVPRHWGFGRSDSQSLTQYSYEVRQSRAVPKQHSVSQLLLETLVIQILLQLIDIEDIQRIVRMGRCVGILDIFLNELCFFTGRFQVGDVSLQFLVIRIYNVCVWVLLAFKDLGRHLNMLDGLKHFKLLFDFLVGINNRCAHEPEVMRNLTVKLRSQLLQPGLAFFCTL